MKDEDFYVCYFLEDGKVVGHAVRDSNEFTDELDDEKSKKAELESSSEAHADDNVVEVSLFGAVFYEFTSSMANYIDILPFAGRLPASVAGTQRKKFNETFPRQRGTLLEKNEKKVVYSFPKSDYGSFVRIHNSIDAAASVAYEIPRMLILGIVSNFDYTVASMVRSIMLAKPHLVTEGEGKVAVQDVFQAPSIEEFREGLLNKAIDNISRRSLEQQVSWIEEQCGIKRPISEQYEKWPALVEIMERRNLFAHNRGYINKIIQ